MNKVVIVSAARTPQGILNGELSGFAEQELAALVLKAAVDRSALDPSELDEAVLGVAKQTSLPSNCARYAVLKAGLPRELSAYTVHRQSASGLQAVANGFWNIHTGDAAAVLAGGAESMTNFPLEIRKARFAFDEQTPIVFHPIEAQIAGTQPKDKYGALTAESLAKAVADGHGISDEAQRTYAERSLALAETGKGGATLLTLNVKKKKTMVEVSQDGHYPEPALVARPGDGAAALVLMDEARAKALGAPILAELLDVCAAAGSPVGDGLTGADAALRLLSRGGLHGSDVARWEVGELSAAQALAFRAGLITVGVDQERAEDSMNPEGGFLATGNPWGAGGALLLARLLDGLKGTGKLGAVVAPSEGGQSMAALLRVF